MTMPNAFIKKFNPSFNCGTCFTYVWHLGYLSGLPQMPGEVIISSTFTDPSGQTQWHLRLVSCSMQGINEMVNGFMVHLYLETPHKVAALVYSAMGCDVQGHGFYVGNFNEYEFDNEKLINNYIEFYEYQDFLDCQDCEDLKLFCDIELLEVVSSGEQWLSNAVPLIVARSFKHYGERDLTLVANGIEMTIHRLVLCTLSPVFAAMFVHAMQEKQLYRVVIHDIEPEILQYLLDFIYDDIHGHVPANSLDIIERMMIAAYNYQLNSVLNGIGQKYLLPLLTADTAIRVLLISERYQLNHFRKCIIEVIHAEPLKVITSDDYIQAIHQHPDLITTLLRSMATL